MSSRCIPEVKDSRCRSVMAPFSPRQPSTAPVVESSDKRPSSTRRNSTTPVTIFEAEAIATRRSGEKSPYIRSKTFVPARS